MSDTSQNLTTSKMSGKILLPVAFCLVSCLSVYGAGKFKSGEKVPLYVNKVGPYFNPHETYHYYSLPVCRPQKIEHKSLTLGEVLDGDRMALSIYELQFGLDTPRKPLCKATLKPEEVVQFRDAVEDLYYFEFVIDDIPVRGFIGHLEESGFLPHSHKLFLWTHHQFNIEYNDDRIIYANVSTKDQSPVGLDVEGDLNVEFTYSVTWIKTNTKFVDRSRRTRDNSFFPKTLEIHWLSIFNSMVLVFLLLGFVTIILTRILKNDFARYNLDDEEDADLDGDENGWKIIHSDVFRFPPYKSLFCAVLGVGSQFVAIATGILLMALLGMFNVHRHGSINAASIVLYALTSCIAGYVAANMYRKMGGETWVWNINLTSCLFAVPFFCIWSVINTVAWVYGSTQALPGTTVVLLGCIWLFVGYPLSVIGGIFGKNWANGFDAPCRTKNIAREIPRVPLYRSTLAHCVIGGFLPFSAISVELYYIFATAWGREQYTLYGILFIVFGILISVTGCISIALTYFQLNAEDYRWWWRSVFSAGSTGIFVFIYAVFYYYKRSNMSGFLQTLEFFGYTLLACYVFFLMLGTVAFFASLRFVRYIYVNVKMD